MTTSFAYDAAGRRTSMTYPSGGTSLTLSYTYLTTNDLTAIKQGTTSLAAFAYDDLGNRSSLTFANGVVQSYGFDPVSRLDSLTNDLTIASQDLAKTFAYNPASQIISETKTTDSYAFSKAGVSETGTVNGLNQLTQYAAKSLSHDTKGNVTGFGADSFVYSSENLMTSATVSGTSTTLSYDPLMRLYQSVSGAATTRFAYDGLDMIAEYDGSGTLQRRYVFDPTGITSQPLIWYEGTGTSSSSRRYLSSDERGSVISVSESNGYGLSINSYDEYGIPAFGALANQKFGYTGQAWLPSAQLWYYKARMYSPVLGRFMQPDPLGYWDSPNLYAYVLNDPINLIDPLGLFVEEDIVITGKRADGSGGGSNYASVSFADTGIGPNPRTEPDIVITGQKIRKTRGVVFSPSAHGTPFTAQSPGEQERNCIRNPLTRRALSSPKVQQSITKAIRLSTSRSSQWEYGFWTRVSASGDVHVWDVGTTKDPTGLAYYRIRPHSFPLLGPILSALGLTPNVLTHTHVTGSVLSVEDVAEADRNNFSIIAVTEDRKIYCYP